MQVFKSECLDWFDKHSDDIYNIVNTLEPKSACLQIGLCPKKAVTQNANDSDEEFAMTNWNVYEMESGEETVDIDIIPIKENKNMDNELSLIECSLCEKVMNKVQNEIIRNKSRVSLDFFFLTLFT